MKKGRRFGDIVSNVYLILLAIVAVFPLLWLLVSAFKSSSEMLNNPTKIWPIQWTLENFKTVLFTLKFTVNIRNSLIIAGSTTVVAIIISSLAAYGVVRFFPKLGNVMTKILVTTYMFPSIMLVIPYAMPSMIPRTALPSPPNLAATMSPVWKASAPVRMWTPLSWQPPTICTRNRCWKLPAIIRTFSARSPLPFLMQTAMRWSTPAGKIMWSLWLVTS